MTDNLPHAIEILRSGGPQTWIVGSHVSPDGDTLGSGIAMKVLLRSLGHRVFHLCPDPVPELYRFMPGSNEVLDEWPEHLGSEVGLVTCDVADFGRLGRMAERMAFLSPIVNVDHHMSNPGYGHVNVIFPDAAATGEVVYHLFKHFEVELNAEAAHAIYVAIVTDTGSFAYEATSTETHAIAGDLIRHGVSPSGIHRNLHENVPICELRIKSLAFGGLRLAQEGRLAWTEVTSAMLEQAGAKAEHTDGIAESMRALHGVEVACFWRETPEGAVKVSLRSKGAVDVAALVKPFGGGGHRRAAGCTLISRTEADTLLQAIAHELQLHV